MTVYKASKFPTCEDLCMGLMVSRVQLVGTDGDSMQINSKFEEIATCHFVVGLEHVKNLICRTKYSAFHHQLLQL